MKANCWEFKKCGRESQGPNAEELGVCQAYLENKLDGVHGGMNAGRSCWVVAGTMCGGNLQGTYAQKEKTVCVVIFTTLYMKKKLTISCL